MTSTYDWTDREKYMYHEIELNEKKGVVIILCMVCSATLYQTERA